MHETAEKIKTQAIRVMVKTFNIPFIQNHPLQRWNNFLCIKEQPI